MLSFPSFPSVVSFFSYFFGSREISPPRVESAAYDQGFDTYPMQGVDNPYLPGSTEYLDWKRGFSDSKDSWMW